MTFDGEVYEEVGLRVKGNSSRTMAQGDALPFKLDMNRYLSGQRLDGLTKINLHNNVNQPAAMNEYLSYGAFREFGVAASRTGWADITLNGQSLGLYTLVEQVNDKMLDRWYDDGDADLYKPESPAGWLSDLGDTIDDYTNVGYEADNDTDHATFLRMVKAISEADASTWNDVINIESVLSYFAGNVALGNWDTYVAMGHNYYLFEATPGKMVMLPWDMNLSQSTASSVCPTELGNTTAAGGLGGGFGDMGLDPGNLPTQRQRFVQHCHAMDLERVLGRAGLGHGNRRHHTALCGYRRRWQARRLRARDERHPLRTQRRRESLRGATPVVRYR